jgi:hypothetical protein
MWNCGTAALGCVFDGTRITGEGACATQEPSSNYCVSFHSSYQAI